MGDLTTIQAARSWLGQTNDLDDVNLQRAISATSAQIESYCSRKFIAADWIERYDGNGKPTLMLKHFPIISVASLVVDGYTVPAADPIASFPVGYLIRPQRTLTLTTQLFRYGYQNILVSYRAGFELGSIPADLELCCLEWLKAAYLNRTTDTSSASASSTSSRGPVIEEAAGGSRRKYATPAQLSSAQSVTGSSFATSVPAPKTIVASLVSYRDIVPL